MNINIDLSPIQNFISLPPDIMFWRFMANFGWMIFAILFLEAVKIVWLQYRQMKFASKQKFVCLAIDIPRNNEQSPRAVENLLAYLAGAHGSDNFLEVWWEGSFQLSFSFEIVSIDGYTQFLIRTPIGWRSLVETAVYSQYPDAEITEVDDYTEGAPTKFPNDEYDIWGTEFVQKSKAAYPIKLYKEFEHQLGPDETYYKDPMASLMDLCSSLQKGEQLWYQIILVPTGFDWIKELDAEVDVILKKKKKDISFGNKIIDGFFTLLGYLSEMIYSIWGDIDETKKEEKAMSMMDLTPKQKKQIEGIHMKTSKLAYLVKIRTIYLAKKEIMNKPKVANGFVGYIKQFSALDLNNLKPDTDMTMTKTAYFAKSRRLGAKKNRIMHNYISRDASAGRTPGLFNVEEIASIWHFPIEAVAKAPMVQKTPGKKAKPPVSLPTDFDDSSFKVSLEPMSSSSWRSANTKDVSSSYKNLNQAEPLDNLVVSPQIEVQPVPKLEIERPQGQLTPLNNLPDKSGEDSPPPNLPFA